ncbi:hypothetical protein VQ056_13385 [Paenibacillus sp. JTLBN-2024]
MTYPKELWEDTLLENPAYPFQLFQNRCPSVQPGESILYLHWHEHFEFLAMQKEARSSISTAALMSFRQGTSC